MTSHWEAHHRHWALLGPPLRPAASVVAVLEREAELAGAEILLLGVTPELAGLGRTLLSVDASPGMIAALWPGDTASRKAVAGSWLDLPLADSSIDAAIGDGSMNSLATAAERQALLREAARVLRPGGRAAIRIFAGPGEREDLAAIRADAAARRIAGFNAFKWRVAMALAGPPPDHAVAVARIRDAVVALFPDRPALSRTTGWTLDEIGTIDSYLGSQATYSFATARRLVEEAERFFESVRLVASGSYPLAERCPVLVMCRPR